MNLMSNYLQDILSHPTLSRHEENECARNALTSIEERDRLIHANLRLVVTIGKNYFNKGLPHLDVLQAGNIGLLKSIQKYDPERGFRFSTYAGWWIKQSIIREIHDKGRLIRVPEYKIKEYATIEQKRRLMTENNKQLPSLDELADEVGKSIDYIQNTFQLGLYPLTIEKKKEDATSILNTLGSLVDFEQNSLYLERQRVFEKAFEFLPPQWCKVMKYRLGYITGTCETIKTISTLIGVSNARIGDICLKSIHKLKSNPKARAILIDYYND